MANLKYEKTSAWTGKQEAILSYSEGYKNYLDSGKTERECCVSTVEMAVKAGFVDLNEKISKNEAVKPGDKIYYTYHEKAVVLYVIGTEPIEKGLNVTAAHIDSPRLDLKAVPLYEDGGLALMKTHYYGGIKKYQWGAVPLSLHGVIYTTDNKKLTVNIGEKEDDPVFFISDLLVHLAGDQLAKPASKVITGEQLNVICGNIPLEDEESQKVKMNVLNILFDTYGIDETSFLSAEIEVVPAGKARDVGFDRSLIASYAHDDRVCAYPAVTALFETENPARTCVCILADKEEIGSVGTTGLKSRYFENSLAEIINLMGEYSELTLRRTLANSYVLSMDVCCGYDPSFAEAFEKNNTALIGSGAILTKFTGSRGKSGSNDAHSEYMHKLVRLFTDNDVAYQTGELGRVDQGGGGTVALILAEYGAHTVDYGVGVLAMHAPYELISKADLYSCYEGAKAFYGLV
ncbi:MAG: aminopeptidase [Anaerofustis stercorihominis]|nr:aminopeptidase [Anaerofustis stercorihominis]